MRDASPDLENLRKRAKLVQREHRSRSFVVAQRIRAGLPDFADLDDRGVLDAPFPLHRAQELVARENGYESWTQLKEALLDMSKRNPTETVAVLPRLRAAHPVLFVRDMERSLRFYRDHLDFEVVYTYGEPAFWAEISRDRARLNLRHTDVSPWVEETRPRDDLLSAMIPTENIKELFVAWKERGVPFHQMLKERPYGREFIVRDPDGNLLGFGPIPDAD